MPITQHRRESMVSQTFRVRRRHPGLEGVITHFPRNFGIQQENPSVTTSVARFLPDIPLVAVLSGPPWDLRGFCFSRRPPGMLFEVKRGHPGAMFLLPSIRPRRPREMAS